MKKYNNEESIVEAWTDDLINKLINLKTKTVGKQIEEKPISARQIHVHKLIEGKFYMGIK